MGMDSVSWWDISTILRRNSFGNSVNAASHGVSRKERVITHIHFSTKPVVADALRKLLGPAEVYIVRSVKFCFTCRFTFTHITILTSNAYRPNTQAETVGAFASAMFFVKRLFTPSSGRCSLQRMLQPPDSFAQRLSALRERATEGAKQQLGTSPIT